jgi:hypothetical protein
MHVSAECLPYTHYCMTTASCGPAGTHFTVIGATERTSCSAGNTFCTKIRLRRATDRAYARGVIDNQIESQQPSLREKKKVCFVASQAVQAATLPQHHPTLRAAGTGEVAHLRIVHLTNASFSGLRSHEFIMSGCAFCGAICVGLFGATRTASSVCALDGLLVNAAPSGELRHRVPELNPQSTHSLRPRTSDSLDALHPHFIFFFRLYKKFIIYI